MMPLLEIKKTRLFVEPTLWAKKSAMESPYLTWLYGLSHAFNCGFVYLPEEVKMTIDFIYPGRFVMSCSIQLIRPTSGADISSDHSDNVICHICPPESAKFFRGSRGLRIHWSRVHHHCKKVLCRTDECEQEWQGLQSSLNANGLPMGSPDCMLTGAIFPSPSRRLLPWQPPQSNQTFRASPGHKILERNTRHSVGKELFY
ncbi:hypothetical protein C0J52_08882 [Blattella germanica]|nr:hypothetical protein C0J52_08882 [Blattella germanica]